MSDELRSLHIDIATCKECNYAGMYYTDCESMHYRNKCEHPKSNGVYIYDGESIPEQCPLPAAYEKPKQETVEQMEQFVRDFGVWWWEREDAADYGITLNALKEQCSKMIEELNEQHKNQKIK